MLRRCAGAAGIDSGREALTLPIVGYESIIEPIMQATGSPLPELDPLREESITAPMRRAMRCLIEKAQFGFGKQTLELRPVTDHPTLRRSPGSQATTQ